jgi:hypothetical protein
VQALIDYLKKNRTEAKRLKLNFSEEIKLNQKKRIERKKDVLNFAHRAFTWLFFVPLWIALLLVAAPGFCLGLVISMSIFSISIPLGFMSLGGVILLGITASIALCLMWKCIPHIERDWQELKTELIPENNPHTLFTDKLRILIKNDAAEEYDLSRCCDFSNTYCCMTELSLETKILPSINLPPNYSKFDQINIMKESNSNNEYQGHFKHWALSVVGILRNLGKDLLPNILILLTGLKTYNISSELTTKLNRIQEYKLRKVIGRFSECYDYSKADSSAMKILKAMLEFQLIVDKKKKVKTECTITLKHNSAEFRMEAWKKTKTPDETETYGDFWKKGLFTPKTKQFLEKLEIAAKEANSFGATRVI